MTSRRLPPGFALLLVLAALNLRPAITSLSPMLPELRADYGLGETGSAMGGWLRRGGLRRSCRSR
ncbi:hypothetical protein [Ornithinimicrobium panacihumi]|uniref:hypothetical protein n=1 Tax=Ornithinimicrobium panacihumi TaxID=2008449 RepID=UPI003F8B8340